MPIPAGNTFPTLPTIRPDLTGALPALAGVSVHRIINGNLTGYNAILEVVNATGAPADVAFVDPGRTPAGNPGDHPPVAVAAGTTAFFKLIPELVDRDTNQITVAFNPTAGISAQVIYG